jgi:hypothetical protein
MAGEAARMVFKALLARALKGDTRAASALIQLKTGLEQAKSGREEDTPFDPEDREVLEGFLARRRQASEPSS